MVPPSEGVWKQLGAIVSLERLILVFLHACKFLNDIQEERSDQNLVAPE
jgi:hypothetical protein